MKKLLFRFLILLQFMTRIPVPIKINFDKKEFGKSSTFFPLVGFIIGGISFFIYYLLKDFVSKELLATIILIVDALLTGGLHLDGLADSFDGLFSYRKKEEVLKIMKDPRIGTNGVLILIFFLFLKWQLLINIEPIMIIVVATLSRTSILYNIAFGKYAKEDGMGNPMVSESGYKEFILGTLISFIILYPLIRSSFFLYLIGGIIFNVITLFYLKKKIGGVTGDTLGAIIELSSVLVLIICFIQR